MSKNKFTSEQATQSSDLPHQYDSPDGSRNHPCEVCSTSSTDPRHIAWEQARLREMAHAAIPQFVRETGS